MTVGDTKWKDDLWDDREYVIADLVEADALIRQLRTKIANQEIELARLRWACNGEHPDPTSLNQREG